VPEGLWRWALPAGPKVSSPPPEFHLHPHYRSRSRLEDVLRNTEPGHDDFIGEQYAAEIGARLDAWSSALRGSPQSIEVFKKELAEDFSGSSLIPVESRWLRSGAIEVRKHLFSRTLVSGDAFLRDLRSAWSGFSEIRTAEFEITAIDASPARIETRIRYDLVTLGRDFYREQRSGYWELAWKKTGTGELRLASWKAVDETQSRARDPIFADVTATAFGTNRSYQDQLLHGSDYWRTLLDVACGIDVYGHNGAAVADIDNNGWDDVYVCQPAGIPNRLYRNRGDGSFEDITESAGVGVLENTACALFADIDNDGRQDLIVVRTSGPLLFLNQGGGRFRLKQDAFNFASSPQGAFTGAAVSDYDRDGWLDVYFCLYTYYRGTGQYKYPLPYYDANNGPPNFMMRNTRDATFTDVTAETGLNQNNNRYSFCCGWNDYNQDGWPDLYVVNDFGRKNLYRNNGNGTFTDVAAETGVEDIGAGMSVCWFDYDNDGVEDLYVANMWTAAGERISTQEVFKRDAPQAVRKLYQKHAMGNSLLRNKGGIFEDITGVAGVGMGRWAWSSDAWDFDHDGFLDLYVTNGMISGPSREDLNSFFWRQTVANSPAEAKPAQAYEQGWDAINQLIRADGTWSGYERNVFYANNRDGTFADVSGAAGLDFVEDGRSFVLADFDGDGRQEVLLKNRSAPQLRLLKNVLRELPPSIAFRLRGKKSNRDAIGTVIILKTESHVQTRSLQAGSGFLSQHSKAIFFGLGDSKAPVKASIRWPSGLVQELDQLPVNHTIWVEEGSPPVKLEPFRPAGTTMVGANEIVAPGGRATMPRPETLPVAVETWLLSPISAPDFSLPDFGGGRQTLAAFGGNRVLLNFWTSESATCRELLRHFQQFHERWSRAGLRLLAINVDDPAHAGEVVRLSRELHLSFPVLQASDQVAGIYNILCAYVFDRHRDLTLPTSLLIDAQGTIVKIYQGTGDLEHINEDFRRIPQSDAERLAKALPFAGMSDSTEFSRNYLSYGSLFFERGYYEQAGIWLKRALRDNPSSADAFYGLGSVYLEQKKVSEARESFQRATGLPAASPDTVPNAWNNLGLLAAREGRTQDAIPYFEQALKLSPDHLIALENLGNAYRAEKRWEDARKTLEHAVRVGPQDAEANYSLGMVYAQLDNPDRAYDFLERSLKLRPDYPEALNNLGVLYMRTDRRDQAVRSFEECIRVAPAFDQSYLNLARVYALEHAFDKAREVLSELLKQHPDHVQAKEMLRQLE
jgi:tetratricopeptide (TPR) repeat protein